MNRLAGCEHPDLLVIGQVPSAAHHLLRLGQPIGFHCDSRANAVRVRRRAAQLHGNAASWRIVAVDAGGLIKIVHGNIQVAVVVQVRERHPVRDSRMVKTPVGAFLDKPKAALVFEGKITKDERLEHKPHLKQFPWSVFALLLQLLAPVRHVHVLHVERMSRGDEKIVVAVQIHIHEDGRPGPLRCRQVGVEADLGVGAVAVVQVNGVVAVLRPVVVHAKLQLGRLTVAQLRVTQFVLAAEHVNDDEIIQAVAVQIRKIYSHREVTALPNGQAVDRAKDALPLVDPDPVGRLEVVAHIEIGPSVAVHVTEHGRQPPVVRRLGQVPSVLVEKRPGGERYRREVAPAIVQVQAVRLPVLYDFSVCFQRKTPNGVGGLERYAVDGYDFRLAVDGAAPKLDARLVADGERPVIDHVQVEVTVTIDIRQGQRHAAALGIHRADGTKGTAAVVEQHPRAAAHGV